MDVEGGKCVEGGAAGDNEVPVAFLDYAVLDHLQRLDSGTYSGGAGDRLACIRALAARGSVQLWMSEIAKVEMLLGLENDHLSVDQRARAMDKDRRKLEIANEIGVKWLTYPASKCDDRYSRFGLSLRCAGPTWSAANGFEISLAQYAGVSAGDARHLVSMCYGVDTERLDYRPRIRWFVTEDSKLRTAIDGLPSLPELRGVRVVDSKVFVEEIEQG